MNKKNHEALGLGTLHEFAANAVYPRKPRRLGGKQSDETLSVDSQFHEFVAQAITPKKRRKLASVSKRPAETQRKKARETRAR